MPPTGKTISGLAREIGVNVETIRYYERRGLIRQPPKPPAGWRRYDGTAYQTVRFVKRAQQLGFTLTEIKELLKLTTSNSKRTCARVRSKARERLDEIDAKVRDLLAMRDVLAELANACADNSSPGQCPILDAIGADEDWGNA